LLLDDVGYIQQSPDEAEILFTLLAERYERRSVVITSNLIFARLGMANWNADASVAGLGSVDDDGWEPLFGVGIGAHFGSLGVRAEYEQFSADLFDELDSDISTISLSFTYTFL
jgi:hypothetical protein